MSSFALREFSYSLLVVFFSLLVSIIVLVGEEIILVPSFLVQNNLVSVTSTNFRKVPILNLHSQILSCTLIFIHNCKIKPEIGLRTGVNILN